MLSDLFSDPDNEHNQKSYANTYNSLTKPLAKRKSINLSGIINQGATCYLNTLIQTLLLTREFRESLFSLKPEELGLVPSVNSQVKVRVIPMELQRLFAQLLTLDQEVCSTTRLTESFGWSNNEELQQHDVQELNRILFNAIEHSLVNTSKAKLIQENYRGTCVNKVKCLSCQNVFEREEEFLDLPITVQGSSGLDESLKSCFVLRENLNGNNQYRCEKCNNQYKDAEKYCQLKTLPPILTFSLLRFTYDLMTFQRIKETSRFEFPVELDLNEYMEDTFKKQIPNTYTKYELFSIIIHSGSAYGGHYHTYIRDFDQLGKWEFPKKVNPTTKVDDQKEMPLNVREVCLICVDGDETVNQFDENSDELVSLDYLKYESPLELLKAFIYNKHKYNCIKVDAIPCDLNKIAGISWNKRFKSKYGTFERFLRKYNDEFEFSNDSKTVQLKKQDRINIVESSKYTPSTSKQLIDNCLNEVDQGRKSPSNTDPNSNVRTEEEEEEERENREKYHWFDFDDSKITPITSSQLAKQFEGKESAYMLFYRRKPSKKPALISREKHYEKIPEWLVNEIKEENYQLNFKRSEFEKKLNSFQVECYLDTDFYIEQNVLNLNQQFENKDFKLEIEKKTVSLDSLKENLINFCTETQTASDNNKEIQLRKETFLNILLEDASKYYFLLANRVDTSSNKGSSSNSTGRYSYFVKALLNEKSENLFQLLTPSNNYKPLLILSKHCDIWPIGDEYEPIRIVVKFESADISYTFNKCTPIKQVKEVISSDYICTHKVTNIEPIVENSFIYKLMKMKRTSAKNENDQSILLSKNDYDHKSLNDVEARNGDSIIVEIPLNTNDLIKKELEAEISLKSNIPHDSTQYAINILNCLTKSNPNESLFKLNVNGSDTINDLKIMSISSFHIDHIDANDCHLRFIESSSDLNSFISVNSRLFEGNKLPFAYCGIYLHDDSALNETLNALIQEKTSKDKPVIFLLCPGRSPLKSNKEIAIKCLVESSVSSTFVSQLTDLDENVHEVLVDLNECRVIDLTNKLIETIGLPKIDNSKDTYYLKTVNWDGDAESVLNNVEALCSSIPLKHNDHLLMAQGVLVPINHYKIKLWTKYSNENVVNELSNKLENISIQDNGQDEVVLNRFIEAKYQEFRLFDELIVKNEMRLEELISTIQDSVHKKLFNSSSTTNNDESSNLPLRLRLLKKIAGEPNEPVKFQMKKCLIETHKPLKQLHLIQENDIYVQLLDEDDAGLNQGIILIDCIRFNITNRLCQKSTFKEIMWNTNNGATLNSLKESIAKSYGMESSEMFKISVAKHLIGKFQWILLKDTNNINQETQSINCFNNNNANKKKKKKPNQPQQQQTAKSNLKSSPFNIDDGDLIAFTLDKPDDFSELTALHFMSEEDLEFTKKKNMSAAEISRIRKERKNGSNPLRLGNDNKSNRRLEVGISIKFDDFNS